MVIQLFFRQTCWIHVVLHSLTGMHVLNVMLTIFSWFRACIKYKKQYISVLHCSIQVRGPFSSCIFLAVIFRDTNWSSIKIALSLDLQWFSERKWKPLEIWPTVKSFKLSPLTPQLSSWRWCSWHLWPPTSAWQERFHTTILHIDKR